MHVFFFYIFVYSYLSDFKFFSQQDPVDNSTWYWMVILGKYSIITTTVIIINIIIVIIKSLS